MCGFEVGPQDNWLITQYISTVVNGTRLSQVSVLVEFALRGCTGLQCQRTFRLSVYETSTEDNVVAADINNYQLVTRIATDDDTGQTVQNRTNDVNLNGETDGFYLAITDETTCIIVSRVLVFYSVCPGGPENLIMRPVTIAPIIQRISTPLQVTVGCVAGASPENGEMAVLSCIQGGTWNPIPGSGCRCDPGFLAAEDGRSCTGISYCNALTLILMLCLVHVGCPVGQYLSLANNECRVCPNNSVGTESGLAVCPCVEDYYRAEGEEDRECTRKCYSV